CRLPACGSRTPDDEHSGSFDGHDPQARMVEPPIRRMARRRLRRARRRWRRRPRQRAAASPMELPWLWKLAYGRPPLPTATKPPARRPELAAQNERHRRAIMRAIGLVSVSFVMTTLLATDAQAASNRWCAVTPKRSENCGYATLDQCRAYMLGL